MPNHTCHICGEVIKQQSDPAANLQARTDHYVTHNSTPAQWTDAYIAITENAKEAKEAKRG